MSKRTAEEVEKFRKDFKWAVNATHIDLDDTQTVCLSRCKQMAEKIALSLSQSRKDYYFEVEEL